MQSSHPGSGRYSSLKYILLQHIYSVAWITCETGENSQTSGTSETNEFMNVVKHWVKMKLIVWMMTEITLFRAKDDWMIMTIMKMLWQKVCGDSSSTTRSWALRWEKGSCEGAVSLVHCHPSPPCALPPPAYCGVGGRGGGWGEGTGVSCYLLRFHYRWH